MDLGLSGKRAIVTGAASGLGAACCKALASEGAELAMLDIREPDYKVETKSIYLKTDLSDLKNVEKTTKQIVQQLGKIDILINCAGVWPTHFVTEMPTSEWIKTMDINMTSVFILCRDFVNHCIENDREEGVILNITSQAAFGGATSGHSHYAAAKAAIVNFTRSLAREVGKNNIRVNALAPGMMKTAMSKDAIEDRLEKYLERIPIGRIAEPSEIADVAVFLVSSKNRYMTGATVSVSGGMLMH